MGGREREREGGVREEEKERVRDRKSEQEGLFSLEKVVLLIQSERAESRRAIF